MSLFDKVFGTPELREAKRLIKTARARVEATYGPLRVLGKAIVESAYAIYRKLGPVFDFSESGRPSQHQILLFYELLYFFCHLTLRTAAAQRLSEAQIGKLQGYLGPLLASTAVDSFCVHWPEDLKAKMRSEFFEKLNDAEVEYAACRGFVSESDPTNSGTLVGRLAGNAAALFEREGDPASEMTVGTEVIRVFGALNLDGLVSNLAKVIDGVED